MGFSEAAPQCAPGKVLIKSKGTCVDIRTAQKMGIRVNSKFARSSYKKSRYVTRAEQRRQRAATHKKVARYVPPNNDNPPIRRPIPFIPDIERTQDMSVYNAERARLMLENQLRQHLTAQNKQRIEEYVKEVTNENSSAAMDNGPTYGYSEDIPSRWLRP